MIASEGYPGSGRVGLPISGVEQASRAERVLVFHSGTRAPERDSHTPSTGIATAGGRVLTVVGGGSSYEEAIDRAYEGVSMIRFEGMQYRTDIGRKGHPMSEITVLILMGSDSDAPVMQGAVDVLRELQIPCEMTVASAHRSPERVMRLVREAPGQGVKVFVVGAGAAAHLAGVVAAHTTLPVIGVPIDSSALKGLDALLSTVQMPPGVPVATVSIGKPGATNAGVLAAQILALGDPALAARLNQYKVRLAQKVEAGCREASSVAATRRPGIEILHCHVRLPRQPGGFASHRGDLAPRRRRRRALRTRRSSWLSTPVR